jgi:hypothetical protein
MKVKVKDLKPGQIVCTKQIGNSFTFLVIDKNETDHPGFVVLTRLYGSKIEKHTFYLDSSFVLGNFE